MPGTAPSYVGLNSPYFFSLCLTSANPPYLGSSRFSTKLNDFVIANYPDVKADLSMVMYKHALRDMCQKNGFVSFITTTSWMFLSSFEKLRDFVLAGYDFESLVDFGTELFEGKVGHNPIVAWVNRKSHTDHAMTGIRLVDYCYSRRDEKETEFFNKRNYHYPKQSNFSKIPGSPVAYWVSDTIIQMFVAKRVNDYGTPRQGLASGDNGRFLRLWHEVSFPLIGIGISDEQELDKMQKWYAPHNKGGQYRKWYGNLEYIIRFSPQNREALSNSGNHLPSRKFYFKTGFTWSDLTSGSFGARYIDCGAVFDTTGPTFFINSSSEKTLKYILGYFNSTTFNHVARIFCSGLHFSNGVIADLPCMVNSALEDRVYEITDTQIDFSKSDWDSYETSWDFKRNPLV